DPRQFGRIELHDQFAGKIGALGPDPLEIGLEDFVTRLRGRKAVVKPLLLNQKFLRGMGNIYADEALHRAGIHPRAIGSRLTRDRAAKLYKAIQEVLTESIEKGGSSVSDYVDSEGRRGDFQTRHRVYGRGDEACLKCKTTIKRILVGQRGT